MKLFVDYVNDYISQNTPDAKFLLMSDGLCEIYDEMISNIVQTKTDDPEEYVDILSTYYYLAKSELPRYLVSIAYIRAIVSKYSNSNLVRILAASIRFMHQYRRKWVTPSRDTLHLDDVATNYLAGFIDTLTSYKNSENVSESVVTDYSPIVPYAGTIRTPTTAFSESVNIESLFDEMDELKKANEGDSSFEYICQSIEHSCAPYYLTIMLMERLITEPVELATILMFMTEVKSFLKQKNALKFICTDNYRSYPVSFQKYVIYCAICENTGANADVVMRQVRQFSSLNDVNSVMESIIDAVGDYEPNEDELTSTTNTILNNAAIITPKNDSVPITVHNEPSATFDIQHLINWISVTRRYRVNESCVQNFMLSDKLASITMYKGYPIIEPAIGNGKHAPFIYCPVIDDLQRGHIRIIKFWKADSKIEILTYDQYLADCQDTTWSDHLVTDTPDETMTRVDDKLDGTDPSSAYTHD